jgi:hypothetical protein
MAMLTGFLYFVTLTFTLAAMAAVTMHALLLREVIKNQHAVKTAMAGPLGEEIAATNVRAEASALTKATIILLLGIGYLGGEATVYLRWLLVLVPVVGIFVSYKNLVSRERQALLAAQFLADKNRVALAKATETPIIISTAPATDPEPPTPGE